MEINEPLKIEDVDFRIQSINKGGYATILPYKNARVDMERLDAVYGHARWQRKHELVNGNLFCSIGVLFDGVWVWKQDVGVESNAEKEKGQASDSFKRAGFNWGIGRELYDYPEISVKLSADEITEKNGKFYASWALKLKEWAWYSEFDGKSISFLAGRDSKGKVRYKWGARNGKVI